MKILQINNTDLPGKIFNGHDLQLSLNRMRIEAWQMVLDKLGEEKTTLEICSKEELIIRNRLTNLEKQLGMTNLLTSFAGKIINSEVFRKADIVHYHLIHNSILSLLDYRRIFPLKRSVWTIHDPWIVGGHCIYPLECEKWKTGCHDCINLDRPFFVNLDKTDCNWQIKKEAVSSIDCDIIVSTDWMENILGESPIG